MTTIWIDADAAPRAVKDIIFRAALRLQLPTVLVANQRMSAPLNNPHVRTVHVDGGPDVADRHIAEHATPGDVAVTADIPLAAILVEKGVVVLDPRGERYTEENVRERLSVRDFMDSLRGAGVETGGASPYGPRDRQSFAAALDRVLTAAARRTD
ncbi:MAG TPA: YaiI/YqxD family protein [Longimicrobiales bacterium]|nr:YaiI/YqxD family protein [Longimicrobiales bacterium]